MGQAWMHVGDTWYSPQDLTVGELCHIETELERSWATIAPARSGIDARALFSRLVARTCEGEDLDARVAAARLIVEAWTVGEISERIKLTQTDDRPVNHVNGRPVVDPKTEAGDSETT